MKRTEEDPFGGEAGGLQHLRVEQGRVLKGAQEGVGGEGMCLLKAKKEEGFNSLSLI